MSEVVIENVRKTETEVFWLNTPSILFSNGLWLKFIPTKDMTTTQKLNALARYFIYLSLFLYLVKPDPKYIWIVILGLTLTIVLFKYSQKQAPEDTTEKFFDDLNPPGCRLPTPSNIFMNTPVTEFNTAHEDPCYLGNPEIDKDVNALFYKDLYQDVSDIYNRNNNERQFFSMPSTMDYAGQKVLADWLYKQPGNCKSDTNYCLKYYYPT